MRSTFSGVTVRLYHLDDAAEGGAATTLLYGPLEQALALAAGQPEEIQSGLWIATDNDVAHYLDLAGA